MQIVHLSINAYKITNFILIKNNVSDFLQKIIQEKIFPHFIECWTVFLIVNAFFHIKSSKIKGKNRLLKAKWNQFI